MAQPEITFRHGLCSASIFEQEFDEAAKSSQFAPSRFSGQLSGQRWATGNRPTA